MQGLRSGEELPLYRNSIELKYLFLPSKLSMDSMAEAKDHNQEASSSAAANHHPPLLLIDDLLLEILVDSMLKPLSDSDAPQGHASLSSLMLAIARSFPPSCLDSSTTVKAI